ncbi:MAG TPA: SRPBCC family protein [Jatrophihabitantaceae bacterium]|nr:SRPBCC family protein [Jatrophihabitantaceae bacterium]
MRFVNTITIDRAPSAVFAYLAEFENVPRWNYAIAETRKATDGPVRVGARYLQLRTIPTRSEETFEVVEFEPDRRLVIRGQIGPFFGDIAYVLEGAANATVLTNTCDLRAHGPLSVVAPLATRRVQSAVAANLDVLKQILERP